MHSFLSLSYCSRLKKPCVTIKSRLIILAALKYQEKEISLWRLTRFYDTRIGLGLQEQACQQTDNGTTPDLPDSSHLLRPAKLKILKQPTGPRKSRSDLKWPGDPGKKLRALPAAKRTFGSLHLED